MAAAFENNTSVQQIIFFGNVGLHSLRSFLNCPAANTENNLCAKCKLGNEHNIRATQTNSFH